MDKKDWRAHRAWRSHRETNAAFVACDPDVEIFLNKKLGKEDLPNPDFLKIKAMQLTPDKKDFMCMYEIRMRWDSPVKPSKHFFRVIKDTEADTKKFFKRLSITEPLNTRFDEFFIGLQLFTPLRNEVFKSISGDTTDVLAKSGDLNNVMIMFRPNKLFLSECRKKALDFTSLLPAKIFKDIDLDNWIYKPLQFCEQDEINTRHVHPDYLSADEEDDWSENFRSMVETGVLDILEEGYMDVEAAKAFISSAEHKVWTPQGQEHCNVRSIYNYADRIQSTSFDIREIDYASLT